MDEERMIRIAVVLAGHLIFLSAAALRFLRGSRPHRIRANAPWWLQYYPPLVWLPLLVAVFARPFQVPLALGFQLAGVAVAVAAGIFGAIGMWSLGRGYGIGLDIFADAPLVTGGIHRVVRHPMYLGIILYHLGAALALESGYLLLATALVVLPYTAARIAAEDRVLRAGFGAAFDAYRERVAALIPGMRGSHTD
ncbi:MAG TPA: isoprenylcysteine carboxylmethyltransferase family protein [Candidatus Saccharimonadales bacterium]|nr:isoprenylcysteine carboxylmethyltransferase family protein [Candidatus Saccharimonadales bacterium]